MLILGALMAVSGISVFLAGLIPYMFLRIFRRDVYWWRPEYDWQHSLMKIGIVLTVFGGALLHELGHHH